MFSSAESQPPFHEMNTNLADYFLSNAYITHYTETDLIRYDLLIVCHVTFICKRWSACLRDYGKPHNVVLSLDPSLVQ